MSESARLSGRSLPNYQCLWHLLSQVPALASEGNLRVVYVRRSEVQDLLQVHMWLQDLGITYEDPLQGVVVVEQYLTGTLKLQRVMTCLPVCDSSGNGYFSACGMP